jgi:hypothetical protein
VKCRRLVTSTSLFPTCVFQRRRTRAFGHFDTPSPFARSEPKRSRSPCQQSHDRTRASKRVASRLTRRPCAYVPSPPCPSCGCSAPPPGPRSIEPPNRHVKRKRHLARHRPRFTPPWLSACRSRERLGRHRASSAGLARVAAVRGETCRDAEHVSPPGGHAHASLSTHMPEPGGSPVPLPLLAPRARVPSVSGRGGGPAERPFSDDGGRRVHPSSSSPAVCV